MAGFIKVDGLSDEFFRHALLKGARRAAWAGVLVVCAVGGGVAAVGGRLDLLGVS